MTLSRPRLLAALLVGVFLYSSSFALAAGVPKDKSAFTTYMQTKLQLYSPSPINLVGPLNLSVGTSNVAVKLPSLKPLHKLCVASPAKCDHAVNDYVQNVTRGFLQKSAATAPAATATQTQPSDAAEPTCMPPSAPNANSRDKCTPPIVDLQRSPPIYTPNETCGWSHTGSKVEGVAIVSYIVHADGSVSNVAVEATSDFSSLDNAAVSMINGRHYFPGTKNGKPIDYAIKSLFLFSCSGKTLATKPVPTTNQPVTPSNHDSSEKPTCMPVDAPNASTHDKCTPPLIDWRHSPQPLYPLEAVRSGETGVVTIAFTVHADGSVSDVTVLQSSGFPRLDDAASSQVRGRHYTPATKNGTPVDVQTKSMIRFDLGTPLYISENWPAVSVRELPGFPQSGAPGNSK